MKVEFTKYGKPLTRENVQELGKYGNRFIVKITEKRTKPGENLCDKDVVYYETTTVWKNLILGISFLLRRTTAF